jgi:hypothetical protein
MKIRLSYYLTQNNQQTAIRGSLVRLREITSLPEGEWEICLANATESTLEFIRGEFPGTPIIHAPSTSDCNGRYVIPLGENTFPSGSITIPSIIALLDSTPSLGAVVGKLDGPSPEPALPSLIKLGATALRKSFLDRAGGLSTFHGPAADYDLTFRLLSASNRIEYRDDIRFQTRTEKVTISPSPGTPGEGGGEGSSEVIEERSQEFENQSLTAREIADLLAVAQRYLPGDLSQIYFQDWAKKYKALAASAGRKRAGHLARFLSRLRSVTQTFTSPDPVSSDVIESIFGLRRHAAAIGGWARRSGVWRVILADYSDNLWATYNACRSTGLQMRCVADNEKAFEDLSYHDLPIVSAARAFEGGNIDGVILTTTSPSKIEKNFNSLRNHFHGPILRLCQTSREAAHVQAAAA